MPNDKLYGKVRVLGKEAAASGDRGLITFQLEIFNQNETFVSKCTMNIFVAD